MTEEGRRASGSAEKAKRRVLLGKSASSREELMLTSGGPTLAEDKTQALVHSQSVNVDADVPQSPDGRGGKRFLKGLASVANALPAHRQRKLDREAAAERAAPATAVPDAGAKPPAMQAAAVDKTVALTPRDDGMAHITQTTSNGDKNPSMPPQSTRSTNSATDLPAMAAEQPGAPALLESDEDSDVEGARDEREGRGDKGHKASLSIKVPRLGFRRMGKGASSPGRKDYRPLTSPRSPSGRMSPRGRKELRSPSPKRRTSFGAGDATDGGRLAACSLSPDPYRHPHKTPTSNGSCVVKYGDHIRLWTRSPYLDQGPALRGGSWGGNSLVPTGGFVGIYSKHSRKRELLQRECLVVVGPIGSAAGHFAELDLQVLDPLGVKLKGQAVKHGDLVVLSNQNDMVWNNKTRGLTGYIDMKPRGLKGEMYVSFQRAERMATSTSDRLEPDSPPPSTLSLKRNLSGFPGDIVGDGQPTDETPLRYADEEIMIMVENSHRLRTRYNQPLTVFKKDSSSVVGGYLCSDGRGHAVTFKIHRSHALLQCVTAFGVEVGKVEKQHVYHSKVWDDEVLIDMAVPHKGEESDDKPVLRIDLTNGAVAILTARQVLQHKSSGEAFFVRTQHGSDEGKVQLRVGVVDSHESLLLGHGYGAHSLMALALKLSYWPFTAAGVAAVAWDLAGQMKMGSVAPVLRTVWDILEPRWLYLVVVTTFLVNVIYMVQEWLQMRHKPPVGVNQEQISVTLLGWVESSLEGSDDEGEEEDNSDFVSNAASGVPPMPRRFLIAEANDHTKALARWKLTLEWRAEAGVDNMLLEPHPNYKAIKEKYFSAFHLPDRDGHLTYYERPGLIDLAGLKALGLNKEELLWHYTYCMEFLWGHLCKEQDGKLTIILDLVGLRMRDVVGEAVAFLKATVSQMSAHYPQRSFKIFILNAPGFFNYVFVTVKPLLNEATKAKINVVPAGQMATELLKVIAPEHLPREYGGECTVPLGESEYDQKLAGYVASHLESSSVSTLPQITAPSTPRKERSQP